MALRYKLQSFEVPIVGVDGELDGPALVCCDYQGIIASTSSPILTLSKNMYPSIIILFVKEWQLKFDGIKGTERIEPCGCIDQGVISDS